MPFTIISPTTLALFRSLDEGAMPSECDLIAFATTRTPGGVTEKTALLVGTVPCRLSSLSASALLTAEQIALAASFKVTVPIATDLTDVERLVVRGTSFGAAWTAELVVKGIPEPRSYSSARHLLAERAQDAVLATPSVGTVIVTEAP